MQKVLIFPGIGSTSAMYHRLGKENSKIQLCDWPKWEGATGLPELAARCIDHFQIDSNSIVGGSSLGGMIASEMAKQVKCRGLILIGSCLDFSCIPIRHLTSTGAWLIKDRWLTLLAEKMPKDIVTRSSLLTDPAFVRWALHGMHQWQGVSKSSLNAVKAIHGSLDATIPASKVNADEWILTGGHLIAMTHFRTVSKFIDDSISEFNEIPLKP